MSGESAFLLLLALAGGYLAGSVPFGLLITRLAGLGDIRAIGSGNIGATNVLRTGHKGLAAATLLLDAGKGAAPVLAFAALSPEAALAAALGAVTGHVFPVWLGFGGGKGVATALGVLLALAWPVGLAACATWLAVAALSRYSSLAAMVAIGLSPLYAYLLADGPAALAALAVAAIVIARHHENVRRLMRGEEPRIGRRGGQGPAPDRTE
ncbi:MAG: glycerol-3-phosphate 1-O-acyltransferase PlsY [Proteobacteria bacterium]|nr:glycerol-3-phosphate 1-O-acyltransferase PlsY [Pseudomonadota bacterium]